MQHTRGGRSDDPGLPVPGTHAASDLLPCLLSIQLTLLYPHHGRNAQRGGTLHICGRPLRQPLLFSRSFLYSLQCIFKHLDQTGNLLQHAWHQYWRLICAVHYGWMWILCFFCLPLLIWINIMFLYKLVQICSSWIQTCFFFYRVRATGFSGLQQLWS